MHGMQRTAAWLLVLIGAISGLACTSTHEVEPTGTRPDVVDACFNVRNVRSYSALNERYVYVRVRSDEHYLLTMDRLCLSLPYSTGILISQEYSRVCSDTRATLTYTDSTSRPASCGIIGVERVADKATAERLAKIRSTPKPE